MSLGTVLRPQVKAPGYATDAFMSITGLSR